MTAKNSFGSLLHWPALGYVALPALLTLTLAACQPNANESLQQYGERLARPQGLIWSKPQLDLQLPYPSPAISELTPVPIRLGLLDSQQFSRCHAGQLLFQGNSSLGRLQQGLSRYWQQRALQRALQECARQQPELTVQATSLAQQLQQRQAADLQLAIATEPAFKHSFRSSSRPMTTLDTERFVVSLEALVQVADSLRTATTNKPSQHEPVQLEQALQMLQQQDYLPDLWATALAYDQYLSAQQPLLAQLSANAGCLSKGQPRRAEVLKNVFLNYYASPIQAQLAQLDRQLQQLESPLMIIEQQLSNRPLKQHFLRLISLRQQLRQSSGRHIKAWQTFFETCQFSPQQSRDKLES
ncbi:DUF3080 family protein [Idiomarina xiamenensis]|uniref:DUF3080 family protein n=1 Tax=Idiomarina xiamenensis TaxID=1207041 RepID=UPI0002F3F7E7|nr:DUF3080 family protein [Idiomarina xiamenensis]